MLVDQLRQQWMRVVEDARSDQPRPFSEQWRCFEELEAQWPEPEAGPMPIWWPEPETAARSNLGRLMQRLGLQSFAELHRWSAEHRERFWELAFGCLGVALAERPRRFLETSGGPAAVSWLPGARLSCVDSCFRADPDAVAVISASESGSEPCTTTYAELQELVDRVAAGLLASGFEPGDAIALYMPMTVECVAAYLGVIRAGCVVVSIADSFAPEELRRRLEISEARAIVTVDCFARAGKQISLIDKVYEASAPMAIVIGSGAAASSTRPSMLRPGDLWWDQLLERAKGPPAVSVSEPSAITNVLFSSGTTGDPKAIPWTQLTPFKCATDAYLHHDVRPGDVLAWPTNIGWMMGPWLIYASLINRSSMVLYQGVPTSDGFVDLVNRAGVTMLGVVPALVRAWRGLEGADSISWPKVRVLSSTGEASSREDAAWLMARTGYRAPLIEYCGGTEIGGGHVTGSVVQPAAPATFSAPALGLDLVIVDEQGQPVAEGETGELFVVPPSIGLSQRLLNRDHDEVYYQGCPQGPDGSVLRRHGDQVTRLARGYFRAQGRADDTMNLGGIKVSSLEIERVVNADPTVVESAAVAVRPSGEGADALVLFVVPDGPYEVEALRLGLASALAHRLNPLFKIHELVVIDELPRTASNKVMRRRLRSRYSERMAEE